MQMLWTEILGQVILAFARLSPRKRRNVFPRYGVDCNADGSYLELNYQNHNTWTTDH